jgi:hypothetical protein
VARELTRAGKVGLAPGARPRSTLSKRYQANNTKGWSPTRRVQAAIAKVLDDGWGQAEAARYYGIHPSTICVKLKGVRAELAVAEERAREVNKDIVRANAGLAPVLGLNEHRRLPKDIGTFVRTYFGGLKCWNCLTLEGEPVRHEIPAFHDEIMSRMTDPAEKRLLVNVPPEHSKTTNGTVFTSLFDIARNPNIQMAVISAGEDLAKDIVGQIQMFLENPEVYEGSARNLIADAGPFRGEGSWTQKQFEVASRRSAEKEPTMRAFGIASKIYGRRIHRIICDDIADVDNNDTPDKVSKMFKKVTSTLDSRVGGNGRLHVVGTRVAPADVYSRLLELSDYTVLRHPCILSYEDETTLWPDHIDFAEAMRRKGRTTAELFELMYQNSDVMAEGASFTKDHVDRAHDESRILGQLPRGLNLAVVLGVDPAGHGKQAGFTAMVLLGIDRASGMRYLIDLVNVRSMSQPQMQAQIFDWTARYRVASVRYETVALQSQIFETAEYRNHITACGARMDRHNTNAKSGIAGKWDPFWGIETMSTSFHNGMVSLPWGDRETRRRVGELEEQLMRFPMEGAPTDLMMAYWIAETGCRLQFERGLARKFGVRQHAEPIPAHLARRRRVHSKGGERSPTAADFGFTHTTPVPRRLANMDVSQVELEGMFGAGP